MFMDEKNQYSENKYIPKPIHKFSTVPIKIFHIHLEPDILECKVKWALGSIIRNKASGDDGIPGELFQILKDDAVKLV